MYIFLKILSTHSSNKIIGVVILRDEKEKESCSCSLKRSMACSLSRSRKVSKSFLSLYDKFFNFKNLLKFRNSNTSLNEWGTRSAAPSVVSDCFERKFYCKRICLLNSATKIAGKVLKKPTFLFFPRLVGRERTNDT